MFMVEIPIEVFKLLRSSTIDNMFDYKDNKDWIKYIDSDEYQKLNQIDNFINFMYLSLGIFVALFTIV